MAEPEVQIEPTPVDDTPGEDVYMGDTEGVEPTTAGEGEEGSMLPDIEPELPKRETFINYLKSPIVQLAVGGDNTKTILSAHEALLVKSPYFSLRCAAFAPDTPQRLIELPDEDLDATGSFLEYLYNNEYFPRRLGDHKDSGLEEDPSYPSPDDTGAALLKHARVYTLADKFGMPALKSLAHSKIHRTSSTAKGEIAYARYVYSSTSTDDTTIRRPVAAFWATRSHVLRHEAEQEFRAMCLEFPQFGFAVLSMVLDLKEKGERRAEGPSASIAHTPGERSGRKRARVSQG